MLNPLFSAAELAVFSSSYQQADARFMAQAAELSVIHAITTLDYEGQGPQQEPLATRAVWLGEHDASRVLVLLSAVHGVEGFTGSAIQLDFLQRLQAGVVTLPSDMAVVLVHAVNPWGFAWCRRVDEQGIDVNRNFVNFNEPLPVNPGYALCADAIVPKDDDWRTANARLAGYLQNVGQYEYELALSGGQYQFPDGLFYGGKAPSQARVNMTKIIEQLGKAQPDMAVIDLHTGLGPYGYGEVICDHPLDSGGMAAARRWYGDSVTSPEAGNSCSVPKTGLVDYAWHQVMNEHSCYITLEFGTYPLQELLRCLREDHRVRKPGAMNWFAPEQLQVAEQLKQLFYPAEPQWQSLVLWRARQVIQLATTGLMNERS